MLVCPDPEYRQRPRLPSSMTRWKESTRSKLFSFADIEALYVWWTQTSKQPYETQVEERRGSKSVTPQASFDTVDTDSDSDSEMTYRRRRGRKRVNLPRLRQKLTGHRNARTMIKVATILWKILIASAGGGLVGEGLHLVWLWLRPPLCLGPQVGGVRDHAWSWQVQFTKLH